MEFWSENFENLSSFNAWVAKNQDALAFRRSLEGRLEEELRSTALREAIYYGFCIVCERHEHFAYDFRFSDGKMVNWRERLVCRGCGLSNRQRVVFGAARAWLNNPAMRIYLTEATSLLANKMLAVDQTITTSEFLAPSTAPGQINDDGIRCEDIRQLSFGDNAFDCVLCFDVLEHIFDFRSALKEIYRTLKDSGVAFISVPFSLYSQETLVRAIIDENGKINHLLEPEFHGDPIDPQQGILCYFHFGWDFLDELRAAGFGEISLRLYWSSDFANIGNEQILISAQKK